MTHPIERLLDIMDALRDEQSGCPWDRAQTMRSIVPHTIEEAYEVADCIERGDTRELPKELGDLLFQVVFYSRIAAEEGQFTFNDVVEAIAEKLFARHPHVFGGVSIGTAQEQSQNWEQLKAAEREAAAGGQPHSELDGVPLALPALSRARKLQQRASRIGFDWPDSAGPRNKVLEEIAECDAAMQQKSASAIEEEVGDLLFACVNWARHLSVDPEQALRQANAKFERRFRGVEAAAASAKLSLAEANLETLDSLWEDMKREERETQKKTGA